MSTEEVSAMPTSTALEKKTRSASGIPPGACTVDAPAVAIAETETNYPLGHESSVVDTMEWRTAANSADFLLPHLRTDAAVLDLGCGAGTITAGFAQACTRGSVVGVDVGAAVVARAAAAYGEQATFMQASATALPFDDGSFDVVFAHQVFKYIRDVPSVLAECRRVLRPSGGLLAIRSGLVDQATGFPCDLSEFNGLMKRSIIEAGGDPQVGLCLPGLARAAGFAKVEVAGSAWCFSKKEERIREFEKLAVVLNGSEMVAGWIQKGWTTPANVQRMKDSLQEIVDCDGGLVLAPHIDLLCWT